MIKHIRRNRGKCHFAKSVPQNQAHRLLLQLQFSQCFHMVYKTEGKQEWATHLKSQYRYNYINPLCSFYLAGALVHIEAGHIVLGHLTAHLGNDVLSQLGSQEGFAGATGSWEDDTAVLHQQVEVPLDDGLWDESVKHQTIYTVLFHS